MIKLYLIQVVIDGIASEGYYVTNDIDKVKKSIFKCNPTSFNVVEISSSIKIDMS